LNSSTILRKNLKPYIVSVDYNGAVVGPEEIKQIINGNEHTAKKIKGFRLISYEDKKAHKHLMIAIELHQGQTMTKARTVALLDGIVEQLKLMNLDFKQAYNTALLKPEIKVYSSEEGIFDQAHQKLKNDYVWNIDYERARKERIVS